LKHLAFFSGDTVEKDGFAPEKDKKRVLETLQGFKFLQLKRFKNARATFLRFIEDYSP
jgi:hypothetical protein